MVRVRETGEGAGGGGRRGGERGAGSGSGGSRGIGAGGRGSVSQKEATSKDSRVFRFLAFAGRAACGYGAGSARPLTVFCLFSRHTYFSNMFFFFWKTGQDEKRHHLALSFSF